MIAFVTCADRPALQPDDKLAAEALGNVEAVPWSATADWSRYELIILRSTWDYHLRLDEFLRWARARERLWNPPHVVEWNARKTYLLELPVPIIPTRVVRAGSVVTERDAVVKPVVSGGAYKTVRLRGSLEVEVDSLVQPFVPEIADGEWSLIFFEGRYSHAVRKVPQAGHFLVQGGSVHAVEAPSSMIAAAQRALSAAPGPALYARVDGVARGSEFLLMELELLEPTLFFDRAPAAVTAFVDAVRRLC